MVSVVCLLFQKIWSLHQFSLSSVVSSIKQKKILISKFILKIKILISKWHKCLFSGLWIFCPQTKSLSSSNMPSTFFPSELIYLLHFESEYPVSPIFQFFLSKTTFYIWHKLYSKLIFFSNQDRKLNISQNKCLWLVVLASFYKIIFSRNAFLHFHEKIWWWCTWCFNRRATAVDRRTIFGGSRVLDRARVHQWHPHTWFIV